MGSDVLSSLQYPIDPSGYYAASSYTMPQYTSAQIQAYYAQYGVYPAGYAAPQQTPQVATAYSYPQGTSYVHPSAPSGGYYSGGGTAQTAR